MVSPVLVLPFILCAVIGYFVGSLPTGFLVAKAKGIDIRTVGSGNIGATNAMRILGKGPGIFVLVVDAAKGFLACAGIPVLLGILGLLPKDMSGLHQEWLTIVAGFTSILGHNFTCWLGFKGGKGIATSAGVLGAMVPVALGIAFVCFAIVLAVTRYVSLGSLVAAVVLPFAAWLTGSTASMIGISCAMSLLAFIKHRANIRRLIAGTEHRIGRKAASTGNSPHST
ncbi:MAG: glycerol-3-phosphate 1-O-acyltransferase PlsY [Verrucomicrobia bacterium]|nr:glycerol-3-phosphate 1-O-acyltransferase PlsY [Verrucomicrobiota bacterium]